MSDKQIVLIGIGHTNAHVLHAWRRSPIPGARLVCVSNFPVATYSGMLPGSLTGQYTSQNMEIDLQSLAKAARAKLVVEPARAVEPETKRVHFDHHEPLHFDLLSVGVGSVPNADGIAVFDGAFIPIKPMQTFLMRLYAQLQAVNKRGTDVLHLVVVGGGVGGIEIGLCLPQYLREVMDDLQIAMSLVDARERIGHSLSPPAFHRVASLLEGRGIDVVTGKRVERFTGEELVFHNGDRMKADLVVWATGATPPELLERIDLPKDPSGFLLTHSTLQSVGDPSIFAVGDSGTVEGNDMPKAGVYAVREGPVLWRNIRSMLCGRPLGRYEPQHDFLRLVNTGDGKALLDYKGWAIHARWCWLLKDWIDNRFMSRFRVTRG